MYRQLWLRYSDPLFKSRGWQTFSVEQQIANNLHLPAIKFLLQLFNSAIVEQKELQTISLKQKQKQKWVQLYFSEILFIKQTVDHSLPNPPKRTPQWKILSLQPLRKHELTKAEKLMMKHILCHETMIKLFCIIKLS